MRLRLNAESYKTAITVWHATIGGQVNVKR